MSAASLVGGVPHNSQVWAVTIPVTGEGPAQRQTGKNRLWPGSVSDGMRRG